MSEVFVDIGSTRVVVGQVPENGLPSFFVFPMERVDEDGEEDELRTTLLRAWARLDGKIRTKKVWLILGLGQVSVERRKETLCLSSEKRIPISPKHIARMRLALLKRVLGDDLWFITGELGSIDLDSIEYFHFPQDKKIFAHTVGLNEFIFSLKRERVSKIKSIFRSLGLKIKGVLVRELLVSKACFSPREREKGAILIDIGFNRSSVIFWKQQRLLGVKVFPYGGRDITSSIMKEFGVPFIVAEMLKRRFIDIESLSLSDGSVRIELQGRQYDVPKQRLSQVVYGCVESILKEIRDYVFTWQVSLDGVALGLTGGVCTMDGVVESTERIFSMPAKMAFCKNQSCIFSATSSPYGLIAGAFWQFVEGEIQFPRLSWMERVWLALRDVWEFF